MDGPELIRIREMAMEGFTQPGDTLRLVEEIFRLRDLLETAKVNNLDSRDKSDII